MVKMMVVALFAVACASCMTSSVMVGKAHPPIQPDEVRVFAKPPAGKYEEVAMVEAQAGGAFTSLQGRTDRVIRNLKKQAAKVGANGIILGAASEDSQGGWGSMRDGKAMAIYLAGD
jgi:hypothetical protein